MRIVWPKSSHFGLGTGASASSHAIPAFSVVHELLGILAFQMRRLVDLAFRTAIREDFRPFTQGITNKYSIMSSEIDTLDEMGFPRNRA